MLINVRELNKIKENGFLKSNIAEKSVLLLIGNSFGFEVSANEFDGYDSSGDGYINKHKVEIKYSASGNGSNNYHIFIETHDKSGNPSGLLTTQSKFYLTITPGWSAKIGSIGQVRLWKSIDLIKISSQCQQFKYPSGVSGFFMIPKQLDVIQVWVGTVGYDKDTQTFDISEFIIMGNVYKIKEALKS